MNGGGIADTGGACTKGAAWPPAIACTTSLRAETSPTSRSSRASATFWSIWVIGVEHPVRDGGRGIGSPCCPGMGGTSGSFGGVP